MSQRARWQVAISRLRSAARGPARNARRRSQTLDAYARTPPTAQNAIDIFKGEWVSRLPPPYEELTGGVAPLYDDPRLRIGLEVIGGVAGKRILELGPLEAGHTHLLDRAGAAHILAVEGNTRAFLRCLVVKELLGIPAAQFVCGDFVQYLESAQRVDVAIASGVLYHMMKPVELIARLSRITDAIYLWTHYYDAALLSTRRELSARIVSPEPAEYGGFAHHVYPFRYGTALERDTFCGGNRPEARWLTRDDILGALTHFGFSRVHPFYEEPGHPHGPAFSVVAQR